MKIAVFQFKSSGNIDENIEAIKRGIKQATENKVRLLVFHECATCGYPPIETPNVNQINFEHLAKHEQIIKQLANTHNIYIALGTIREVDNKRYNSTIVIDPNGKVMGTYDKRALWGWDTDNFEKGEDLGIYKIDDLKIGFRICFEVRFPEYFRELFQAGADLCITSFYDTSDLDSPARYEMIKAHLITRAVENVMPILSVNSISRHQTAPTAVFDQNGTIIKVAPKDKEYLLTYDHMPMETDFGAKGRLENSHQAISAYKAFLKNNR